MTVPKDIRRTARAIDLDLDHNTELTEDEVREVVEWVLSLPEETAPAEGGTDGELHG